jgi:hypothetical protein
MQLSVRVASLVLVFCAGLGVAHADSYTDSIAIFKKAGESAAFFRNSYAYAGRYIDGMAVFTIAKGGLMYAATLSGQKYSYKARGTKGAAANP